MNSNYYRRIFTAGIATLAIAGCGGGGTSDGTIIIDPAPPPTGGIEGSGIAIGVITGFGSVIVNDVRYDSSAADITVDGAAATEADLSVGDVVMIVGQVEDNGSEGTADTILLDHVVEGPVSDIDAQANTFVVLGQTIVIDGATGFDDDISPESIDGLAIGEQVEISGFVAADGTVFATRIERDDDTELELTGVVASLDPPNRFVINGQSVGYSGAVLSDFPSSGIADGDLVEVKGDEINPQGELVATSVELKDDDLEIEDGDELEIEGLITRFVSASDFDVAGIPVTTVAATEFENGAAGDLALNGKVEVEGDFAANGVLVADKVKIRRASNIRIDGLVDSIAGNALVVLGVTINVDGLTRYEDKSSMEIEMFSLLDISVGDFVEVRGSESAPGSGELVATKIERDDDEDNASIRGPVTSIAPPSLVVFGVTVDTDGDTEFEGENDMSLTAAEFFGVVTVGSQIEAKGSETGDSALLADEVELEDD